MSRFAIVPTEVLRHPALTAQDKLVLAVLTSYADTEGYCWPSVGALATDCGLSERTVRYAIGHLHELGVIEVERRQRENGSQTSNAYWVCGYDRGTLHLVQGGAASGAGEGLHTVQAQNSTSKNRTIEQATTTTKTAREAVLQFDTPAAQDAYLAYRRAHRHPAAFDATLTAMRDGMTTGQTVSMEAIGRALLELQGNGEQFNIARLRGYVRGLDREPLPPRVVPGKRGGAVADKDAAVAQMEAILAQRGVKL